MARSLLMLLIASCSALVDDSAARDVCLGPAVDCEQVRFARAWYALHALGWDDSLPLRAYIEDGPGDGHARYGQPTRCGSTIDALYVDEGRGACHELVHVHLVRQHPRLPECWQDEPHLMHDERCLWGDAAWWLEVECKSAMVEVARE